MRIMSTWNALLVGLFAILLAVVVNCGADDKKPVDDEDVRQAVVDQIPAADAEDDSEPPVDPEELEYRKGSLCGYCTYCKFCRLCERDCPCEVGPGKPNCHMCKYCKFCYMCRVCDTVCQPGGIIDRVTSRLFNTLPQFDKSEVDKDIDGVQSWIDKTKDEL